MCQSVVNIQSPTAEIRRGKKRRRKKKVRKKQDENIMVALLHRATIIIVVENTWVTYLKYAYGWLWTCQMPRPTLSCTVPAINGLQKPYLHALAEVPILLIQSSNAQQNSSMVFPCHGHKMTACTCNCRRRLSNIIALYTCCAHLQTWLVLGHLLPQTENILNCLRHQPALSDCCF